MLPAVYRMVCRGFHKCLIRLLPSVSNSQSVIVFPFHSMPCSYPMNTNSYLSDVWAGLHILVWSFYFKMDRNFNFNIQAHLRVDSCRCSVVYLHSGGTSFISWQSYRLSCQIFFVPFIPFFKQTSDQRSSNNHNQSLFVSLRKWLNSHLTNKLHAVWCCLRCW
jgi:hypothetical protein